MKGNIGPDTSVYGVYSCQSRQFGLDRLRQTKRDYNWLAHFSTLLHSLTSHFSSLVPWLKTEMKAVVKQLNLYPFSAIGDPLKLPSLNKENLVFRFACICRTAVSALVRVRMHACMCFLQPLIKLIPQHSCSGWSHTVWLKNGLSRSLMDRTKRAQEQQWVPPRETESRPCCHCVENMCALPLG